MKRKVLICGYFGIMEKKMETVIKVSGLGVLPESCRITLMRNTGK